jgi:hypothetical protein
MLCIAPSNKAAVDAEQQHHSTAAEMKDAMNFHPLGSW